MTYYIDIQNASDKPLPLTNKELTDLAELALQDHQEQAELTLRLVSSKEMCQLNHAYRKQNKPTNVLAFPCLLPEEVTLECPLLGDIIICPEVLLIESQQQNKTLGEHWALIVIHGVLHLLGYDHVQEEEATVMQRLETKLLAKMGYRSPYDLEENTLE